MEQPVQEDVLPTRWEVELEFVQSLANLNYLNYLAQNKYLDDLRFMSYLNYLYNYWSLPSNAKFLIYPNCLQILHLLLFSKDDYFKNHIVQREFADTFMNQMVENWQKDKI
ncbi:mediator complex subunit SOH1 [Ascoidea rubescens DSM 1968]|uniref:Mediator of RNA polymerase II transcription subunit 31 n=1 Tax=Ascoidea rubescens DSM 1968 TaxID=1344418 RepID=A0A1D2VLR5_9ASCO|nr:SOH1-domain-containing protein [Ascoidea rubescens DSM 1968]ODV62524.1 SOH1-domain-containing protein [Ascoidea rubescens DSM 1968]